MYSKNDKVTEAMNMLQEGLEKIQNGKEYRHYLSVMSHFPDYSAKNSMLIYQQCPTATFTAGFNTWKKLSRHVKKGEKGIRILAPIIRKHRDDKPVNDKDKDSEQVCRGYRTVYIFDISQTEGKPLPEFRPEILTDSIPEFETLYNALVKVSPFKVEKAVLKDSCNGLTSYEKQTIYLRDDRPELQTVKTLIHEIAHSLLHNPLEIATRQQHKIIQNSCIKETEAESVAYVVSQFFGLDSGDYSFPYITIWKNRDENEISLEDFIDRIGKTANEIIQNLNRILLAENHPLAVRNCLADLNTNA